MEEEQWNPEKGLELVTIGDGIQALGYTTGTIKPGNALTRTLHLKVVMKEGTYKFRQDIPLPSNVAGSNGLPVESDENLDQVTVQGEIHIGDPL